MSNKNQRQPEIKWLSDKDLATRYGVSRATVWRWVREGHLPAPRKIGQSTSRWPVSEIDEHDRKILDA